MHGNMIKCGLIAAGLIGLASGAVFSKTKRNEDGTPQVIQFNPNDIVRRAKPTANDPKRLVRYRVVQHIGRKQDLYIFQRVSGGRRARLPFENFSLVKDINGEYDYDAEQPAELVQPSRRESVSAGSEARSPQNSPHSSAESKVPEMSDAEMDAILKENVPEPKRPEEEPKPQRSPKKVYVDVKAKRNDIVLFKPKGGAAKDISICKVQRTYSKQLKSGEQQWCWLQKYTCYPADKETKPPSCTRMTTEFIRKLKKGNNNARYNRIMLNMVQTGTTAFDDLELQ